MLDHIVQTSQSVNGPRSMDTERVTAKRSRSKSVTNETGRLIKRTFQASTLRGNGCSEMLV